MSIAMNDLQQNLQELTAIVHQERDHLRTQVHDAELTIVQLTETLMKIRDIAKHKQNIHCGRYAFDWIVEEIDRAIRT